MISLVKKLEVETIKIENAKRLFLVQLEQGQATLLESFKAADKVDCLEAILKPLDREIEKARIL